MGNLRKDETIQAVLIADTYNENFQPFGAEGSPVSIAIIECAQNENYLGEFHHLQCMLPLVNTPMIDYALEALNKSKVEEVFLFCSNHMDEIKAHVKWVGRVMKARESN